jgi:hypothetical protein
MAWLTIVGLASESTDEKSTSRQCQLMCLTMFVEQMAQNCEIKVGRGQFHNFITTFFVHLFTRRQSPLTLNPLGEVK